MESGSLEVELEGGELDDGAESEYDSEEDSSE
jgi:hypothetical protein